MQQRQVDQELQRFHQDVLYVEAHYEQLLKQYPEQWVAIFNQQVVGASPNLEQLLDELQAMGIPPGQGFVEHLTTEDVIWTFWS